MVCSELKTNSPTVFRLGIPQLRQGLPFLILSIDTFSSIGATTKDVVCKFVFFSFFFLDFFPLFLSSLFYSMAVRRTTSAKGTICRFCWRPEMHFEVTGRIQEFRSYHITLWKFLRQQTAQESWNKEVSATCPGEMECVETDQLSSQLYEGYRGA